jgi:hypothetical protein
MSQENVEIVRRSTDAYNRRDLDGIVEHWAPDAVLDWSNSRGLDAGVYRGHDEIRAFTHRFLAAWDDIRLELDDPIEVRRHRDPGQKRLVAHVSRWPADLAHALPDDPGRPRSRPAVGVGDVAGERGDRAIRRTAGTRYRIATAGSSRRAAAGPRPPDQSPRAIRLVAAEMGSTASRPKRNSGDQLSGAARTSRRRARPRRPEGKRARRSPVR